MRHPFGLCLVVPLALLRPAVSAAPASGARPTSSPPAVASPAAEPPAPPASAPIERLLAEARRQQQAGQSQAALAAAEAALGAARQAGDAAGEARACWARGLALRGLGRSAEAFDTWKQAAAAWQRAGDGPGEVLALAAAGLLVVVDQPDAARALFAQAGVRARAEARRPRAAAGALEAAGDGCVGLDRAGAAGDLWAAAVALRSRYSPGSLELARDMDQLGRLQRARGELVSARASLRQAAGIFARLTPGSSELLGCLDALGAVSHQLGDLATAGTSYRHALALEERQAPDSLGLAEALGDVGLVAYEQGDLVGARQLLVRAEALFQKHAPASALLAACLDNLGAVAFAQGDLSAAREFFLEALAIQHRLAPGARDEAMSFNNLGNVLNEQGNLVLADQFYRRGLAIDEMLAPDSLEAAAALHNLASVALSQGHLAEARQQYERALTIKETQAPGSLEVARTRSDLGIVLLEQGSLEAARQQFQQALDLFQMLAPDSLDLAGNLANMARLAGKRGDWAQAERWASQAWDRVQRQAAGIEGDDARQAFGSSIASLAAVLLQAQVARGHGRAAFETMEEARAQALLQMLLERPVVAGLGTPRAWAEYRAAARLRDQAEEALSQASVKTVRARRALAAAQEAQAPAAELTGRQQSLLAAVEGLAAAQSAFTRNRLNVDQQWDRLRKGAPQMFARPLSLAQAARSLAPGELYAGFAVGPEQSELFLLRRGQGPTPRLSVLPINLSDTDLRRRVQAFRLEVTDPESDPAALAAAGRALFSRLFPAPARRELQRARRLLLSPYGPLWELPFAALVVNAGGPPRYLGETVPLAYTPSLALLARARRDRPRRRGSRLVALVIGDVQFERPAGRAALPAIAAAPTAGDSPPARPEPPASGRPRPAGSEAMAVRAFLLGTDRPPRLPGTRAEALQVARLYHAQPLLGGAATEAAVRRAIGEADVVHLATHGYLNPYRPIASGVLLAAPEREAPPAENGQNSRNDGVLQAWEIHSQMHLKAELVVLSACETARGANVLGEGIVGLTRALEFAGARSVMASQWSVADAGTQRLMIAFHRRLLRGESKDAALQQAMALLRRDHRTAHPYYWAAFVLTGDPDTPRWFR